MLEDEPAAAQVLEAARSAMRYAVRQAATRGPPLEQGDALIDYLIMTMAHEPRELFRVLYLDAKLWLIRDEMLGMGTIREAPAYPREIFRRAFELKAAAMILVHSHPSGDPRPSRADIDLTRRLKAIAAEVDVPIKDHLVVTRSGWLSFKAEGLL